MRVQRGGGEAKAFSTQTDTFTKKTLVDHNTHTSRPTWVMWGAHPCNSCKIALLWGDCRDLRREAFDPCWSGHLLGTYVTSCHNLEAEGPDFACPVVQPFCKVTLFGMAFKRWAPPRKDFLWKEASSSRWVKMHPLPGQQARGNLRASFGRERDAIPPPPARIPHRSATP